MRIMGRARALVAVGAGAFLLAGCGSGPNQAGAAAFVGGTAISLDDVQQVIDKAVSEQPFGRQLAAQHKVDAIGREAVRQLIVHELLVKAAAKQGLVPDEGEIALEMTKPAAPVSATDDEAAAVTQVVARARDPHEQLSDANLEKQLATKAQKTLSVTFDYIALVPGESATTDPAALKQQAFDIARKFAADPAGARQAMQQQLSEAQQQASMQGQDPSGIPIHFDQVVTAAQAPALAVGPVFGVPANTVVAVQASIPQNSSWYVFMVNKRSDSPVAGDAAGSPTPEQVSAIGIRMLQSSVADAGIRVNPRYGVWDVAGMNIAPNKDVTTGLVVPYGAAAPQQ